MYCGCENRIIFSHKNYTSSLLLLHSQHSSDTQVMWNEMVTNQKNNNNRLAWPFVNWKWNQGCSEWFPPPSNELLVPIGVVSFSFIRGSLNALSTHVITVTCSDLCKSPDRNWSQHLLDPGVCVHHHHHYYQNTRWRKSVSALSLKYNLKYLENQYWGAWRSNSLTRCFMLFFFFNFHFITLQLT